MATFGSTINPALGRVDYSPLMQGAGMASQGIMQGAQGIAQGLQMGVQNYLQKQEEKTQNKAAQSMITRILETNPAFAKQLGIPAGGDGKYDPGAIKAAIKGAGGPMNAIKLASTLEELQVQQKQRQTQEQAAAYAGLLEAGQGRIPSPVSNQALSQFAPEAVALGKATYLKNEQTRKEIEKLSAESARLRIPPTAKQATGPEALFQARKAAIEQQFGRSVTPQEEVQIRTEIATLNRPTTNINTGDNAAAKIVAEKMFADRELAVAAQNSLPAYDEADKLLDEGNVLTGGAAEARLGLAKVLNVFGVESKDAENTEVLRAQIAIPVLRMVKMLGSGSGISNKDLEFAEKAAGGAIKLEGGAIKRLVGIGRIASKRQIEMFNKRLDRTYPKDDETTSLLRRSLMLEESATPGVISPRAMRYLQ